MTRPAAHRRRRLLSSLKARLLLLAAMVAMIGLGVFAWQLSGLFRQHVERGMRAGMQTHLEQLVVALRRRPDGSFATSALLPEPRFMRPLSGLYWQVTEPDGHLIARSRSLWDARLPPPPRPLPAKGALWFTAQGPAGENLLVLARRLRLPANLFSNRADVTLHDAPDGKGGNSEVTLLFMLARDRAEIERAVEEFNHELLLSLALLAVVLLLALSAQAWLGLRPLAALRRQLGEIRRGKRDRLDAPPAAEIDALVDELNDLLAQQKRHMEQARARAGNLAHGLKTPLASLSALARDLEEAGQDGLARAVRQQVGLLRRQVEHELSRARVRGGRQVAGVTALRPCLERLLATMRRLHDPRTLTWTLDAPGDPAVRMEEGDLLELAGNLMENAAKWAASTVRIHAERQGDVVALTVEDDGPGVPPAQRARILKRGVRLDENMPGSGIGLSIVQEIVEAYGGRLELSEGAAGGLRVTTHLPAGGAAPA